MQTKPLLSCTQPPEAALRNALFSGVHALRLFQLSLSAGGRWYACALLLSLPVLYVLALLDWAFACGVGTGK